MSAFTIREFNDTDAATIAAWMVQVPLWQRYGVTVEPMIGRLLDARAAGDLLLVAAVDGVPVGLAWVLPRGMFGRSPYLRTIGAHPDYIGQGIGSALLTALEDRLRPALLFLLVSEFNTDAQRLYERHGFARIGTVPEFVLPDVDELLYLKRLVVAQHPAGG
jgi:ribosomal protein S18 acetylase RimI-like enzyme